MRLLIRLEDVLSDNYSIARLRIFGKIQAGSCVDADTIRTLRVMVDCVGVVLSSAVISEGWIIFPKNSMWESLGALEDVHSSLYKTNRKFYRMAFVGGGSLIDPSKVLECISMAARSTNVSNWTSFRVVKTHRSSDGINATYEIEIGTGALAAPTGGL